MIRDDRILIQVTDGEVPQAEANGQRWTARDFDAEDLVFSRTDACRNLGFLVAAAKGVTHVVTLDDDVRPIPGRDPIAEHLDVLGTRAPTSWFSIASEYMRGFPYGVRAEAEVLVSHGVWDGVHDYDGPTQLVVGVKPATFYRGVIPSGCLFACCGMNLAFKIEALPWVYFAPMGKRVGFNRFADIWMGVHLKRRLDAIGAAVVTGYSRVIHERASDVFKNLEDEARGIGVNEVWWRGVPVAADYFAQYDGCRSRWESKVLELLEASR